MTKRTAAVAAVLGLAGACSAQLGGTTMNIYQEFDGNGFFTFTDGVYTYGSEQVFVDAVFGDAYTWVATSPADQPGFDNSILADYTGFDIWEFEGGITMLQITKIALEVEPGSPTIFDSAGKVIATGVGGGNSFTAEFKIDDVTAGPTDTIVIAWNSVGGGGECYPDFDGNGVLNLFDFLAFVSAFNAGSANADCDKSGGLNLFDFLCFTSAFNAGC